MTRTPVDPANLTARQVKRGYLTAEDIALHLSLCPPKGCSCRCRACRAAHA